MKLHTKFYQSQFINKFVFYALRRASLPQRTNLLHTKTQHKYIHMLCLLVFDVINACALNTTEFNKTFLHSNTLANSHTHTHTNIHSNKDYKKLLFLHR